MASDQQHYFTAQPATAAQLRERTVVLRGQRATVLTAPGVFSQDGLDLGTRVLLDMVGDPPSHGTLVDVGCGWGPMSLAMAHASPQAAVFGVDVNERAVDLTRRNAQRMGLGNVTALPADTAVADPRLAVIDEIWSNPPVRIGKRALHALLQTWLPRLAAEGAAYLVVQKNLGADSLHAWLDREGYLTKRRGSSKGFRVLEVRRGDPAAEVIENTSTVA